MHCYTRFTQVKNRCIMGGKGRGVFSDFRLGRVCPAHIHGFGSGADVSAVSIPNKCARWKPAGCQEGKLVKRRQTGVSRILCVYYCEAKHRIGRRLYVEHDMISITCDSRHQIRDHVLLCARSLTAHGRNQRGYPPCKQTRRLNRYRHR
jgi:hypothetical protein